MWADTSQLVIFNNNSKIETFRRNIKLLYVDSSWKARFFLFLVKTLCLSCCQLPFDKSLKIPFRASYPRIHISHNRERERKILIKGDAMDFKQIHRLPYKRNENVQSNPILRYIHSFFRSSLLVTSAVLKNRDCMSVLHTQAFFRCLALFSLCIPPPSFPSFLFFFYLFLDFPFNSM